MLRLCKVGQALLETEEKIDGSGMTVKSNIWGLQSNKEAGRRVGGQWGRKSRFAGQRHRKHQAKETTEEGRPDTLTVKPGSKEGRTANRTGDIWKRRLKEHRLSMSE